jgi:anti-sigma-K factor RskA
MTERDEIDVLAGEYVLGTLDAEERAAANARRRRDPALNAAIEAWEHRLAPLAETVPSVTPPEKVRVRVEEALAKIPAAQASASVVALKRQAQGWRRVALAASALAACLLVAIVVRERSRPEPVSSYVAVFQKDDASPAFLLTVDLDKRQLSVQRVAAEPQSAKSYQLWIASEKIGDAPRSLGLIEAKDATTQRTLAKYDRAIVEGATFGISLEPAGGSPTGRPTGPAFHAKLIKTPR